jgi:hypothetical protein
VLARAVQQQLPPPPAASAAAWFVAVAAAQLYRLLQLVLWAAAPGVLHCDSACSWQKHLQANRHLWQLPLQLWLPVLLLVWLLQQWQLPGLHGLGWQSHLPAAAWGVVLLPQVLPAWPAGAG